MILEIVAEPRDSDIRRTMISNYLMKKLENPLMINKKPQTLEEAEYHGFAAQVICQC